MVQVEHLVQTQPKSPLLFFACVSACICMATTPSSPLTPSPSHPAAASEQVGWTMLGTEEKILFTPSMLPQMALNQWLNKQR